ncbi:MAG: 4a-hydroxytetrahydrobiopterin dehydratase [Actinomycetota bacterium]
MTVPPVLSDDVLTRRLGDLPGWAVVDGKLHRELRFPDFTVAWGVMSSIAIVAEKMNHHPEWSNVYSRVVIDLVTHDAGGITELDLELATEVERLAAGSAS